MDEVSSVKSSLPSFSFSDSDCAYGRKVTQVALPVLLRAAIFFGALFLAPLLAPHFSVLFGGCSLLFAKGLMFALAIEFDSFASSSLKKGREEESVFQKSQKRKLLDLALKTVFRTGLFFAAMAFCPVLGGIIRKRTSLSSFLSLSLASGIAFAMAFSVHNKAMSLGEKKEGSLTFQERSKRHSLKFTARSVLFFAAVALGSMVPGGLVAQSAGQGGAFAVASKIDEEISEKISSKISSDKSSADRAGSQAHEEAG